MPRNPFVVSRDEIPEPETVPVVAESPAPLKRYVVRNLLKSNLSISHVMLKPEACIEVDPVTAGDLRRSHYHGKEFIVEEN